MSHPAGYSWQRGRPGGVSGKFVSQDTLKVSAASAAARFASAPICVARRLDAPPVRSAANGHDVMPLPGSLQGTATGPLRGAAVPTATAPSRLCSCRYNRAGDGAVIRVVNTGSLLRRRCCRRNRRRNTPNNLRHRRQARTCIRKCRNRHTDKNHGPMRRTSGMACRQAWRAATPRDAGQRRAARLPVRIIL